MNKFEMLCATLPAEVNWGDPITPALVEEIVLSTREACAQVCEGQTEGFADTSTWDEAALSCARTIRMRSKRDCDGGIVHREHCGCDHHETCPVCVPSLYGVPSETDAARDIDYLRSILAECAAYVLAAAEAEHLLDGFRRQRRPLDGLADRVRAALRYY